MKLEEIRFKIDTIDRELLQLLEARMEYALRSTRLKLLLQTKGPRSGLT